MLRQAGHQTELLYDPSIVDTPYFALPLLDNLRKRIDSRLLQRARDFAPDLIAFSAHTFIYPFIKQVATNLKEELGVPMIIGGVHASVLPEKMLDDGFDIVCIGEGEGALLELVSKLEAGEDITGIRNLWLKDDSGTIHRNSLRPLFEDLDGLPYWDKDLFNRQGAIFHRLEFLTCRDCPFSCTFCYNSAVNQVYKGKQKLHRRMGVDRAIEELIVHRNKLKPWGAYIYDDIFVMDIDWLEHFCDQWKSHIGVDFGCNVHPQLVNHRIMRALKDAGCYIMDMGVQTGNEDLRRSLNRRETNAQITWVCSEARKMELKVCLQYIFGLPGETPSTMAETVKMNRLWKPHYVYTTLLAPLPGTKILDQCIDAGLLDEDGLQKIYEGYYSFHKGFLLKHPYREMVINMKYLFPLFSEFPVFIGDKILLRLIKRRYGLMTRILGIIGIPIMDFRLALEKFVEMLYSTWRFFRGQPAHKAIRDHLNAELSSTPSRLR